MRNAIKCDALNEVNVCMNCVYVMALLLLMPFLLDAPSTIIRSGAVFRSEGSPLNPKDLLQIYVILAVGACVLCQFKVCCDVC